MKRPNNLKTNINASYGMTNPCGEINLSEPWVYKGKKYYQTTVLGIDARSKIHTALYEANGRPSVAALKEHVEGLVNSSETKYARFSGEKVMEAIEQMWDLLKTLDTDNPAKQLLAVREINKQ